MTGGRRPGGGGRSRLALATVLGLVTHSRAIEYLDVPRSR
jgi:hypothetical protein